MREKIFEIFAKKTELKCTELKTRSWYTYWNVINYRPTSAEAEILILDLLILVASEATSSRSDLASEMRSSFVVLFCSTA